MNNQYSENDRNAQVTQVGFEYLAGQEGDAQINRLIGFDSGVFGGRTLRKSQDAPAGTEWLDSPDFHQDEKLCLEMLSAAGAHFDYVLSTVPLRARKPASPFVTEFVTVFQLPADARYEEQQLDGILCTAAQPTQTQSIACALWFALSAISHE